MRDRAFRRHHKKRMKKKARNLVRNIWGYSHGDDELVENIVHNCDNLKVCPGDCCKNPRRSGWSPAKGKTIEEQIDELPIVYFTDLDGSFPNDYYGDGVFWLIRKNQTRYGRSEVPFGTIIEIED